MQRIKSRGAQMSNKNSAIQNIQEIKKRSENLHLSSALFLRLSKLEKTLKSLTEKDDEVLKYFPVAIVACFEAYFKLAISEIIDRRSDLKKNAVSSMSKNIKIDIESMSKMNDVGITIGELIAYNLQYSSFEKIEEQMSLVLDSSFKTKLANVHNRFLVEVLNGPTVPIVEDIDKAWKSVRRIFELRHIICHELPNQALFDSKEIVEKFTDCVQVLNAADEIVGIVLEPNAPLTQIAINEQSVKDLELKSDELQSLKESILKLLDQKNIEEFTKANEAWTDYAESWAEFESGYFEGGSIRFSVRNITLCQMYSEHHSRLLKYKESLLV